MLLQRRRNIRIPRNRRIPRMPTPIPIHRAYPLPDKLHLPKALPPMPIPVPDPLLNWASQMLESSPLDYDAFRNGSAFCQLLHLVYPEHIDLGLVHFQCTQMVQFILNYEYLQLGLARANIFFHVPVHRLIIESDKWEVRKLINWFHDVYEQRRSSLPPYPARRERRMSDIGQRSDSTDRNIVWQCFFELKARRVGVGHLTPEPLQYLPAMIYGTQLSRMAIYVAGGKFGLANVEMERDLMIINNYGEGIMPTRLYWADRHLLLDLQHLRVARCGNGYDLPRRIDINRRLRSNRLPWQPVYLLHDELLAQPYEMGRNLSNISTMLRGMSRGCFPLRCLNSFRRLFDVRLIEISYTEWVSSLVEQRPKDDVGFDRHRHEQGGLLLVLINLNATNMSDISHWSSQGRQQRFRPRNVWLLPGYLGDQLEVLQSLTERQQATGTLLDVSHTLASVLPLTEPLDGAYEHCLWQALEDWVMYNQETSDEDTAAIEKHTTSNQCVVT